MQILLSDKEEKRQLLAQVAAASFSVEGGDFERKPYFETLFDCFNYALYQRGTAMLAERLRQERNLTLVKLLTKQGYNIMIWEEPDPYPHLYYDLLRSSLFNWIFLRIRKSLTGQSFAHYELLETFPGTVALTNSWFAPGNVLRFPTLFKD